MTGISDCTYGLALPVQESLAQALGRSLPLVLGTDNDAARQAVMAGHSRRLAYVRRHQRVSLGTLHDTFGPGNVDGNRLVRTPPATMPVDVQRHIIRWMERLERRRRAMRAAVDRALNIYYGRRMSSFLVTEAGRYGPGF